MKTHHKLLTSGLLAAIGLIGVQATAVANDDYNRWGQDRPHMRAWQESRQLSDKIDDRQDNQLDRIMEGFRTGKLTQNEFFALMQEQRSIRAQERQYLADGFLSPREFEGLDRALDRAGTHIRFEKHDRDAAYKPAPRPFGNPWSH